MYFRLVDARRDYSVHDVKRSRRFTMSLFNSPRAVIAIFKLLTYPSPRTSSLPASTAIPEKVDRNPEIFTWYTAGECALNLANEFGISVRRVNWLDNRILRNAGFTCQGIAQQIPIKPDCPPFTELNIRKIRLLPFLGGLHHDYRWTAQAGKIGLDALSDPLPPKPAGIHRLSRLGPGHDDTADANRQSDLRRRAPGRARPNDE